MSVTGLRGRIRNRPAAVMLLAAVLGVVGVCAAARGGDDKKPSAEAGLREIYREVLAMGPHPGQAVIHWDFFIGEDDDDTNKDIHAAVIISGEPGALRMTLRISWMERIPGEPKAFRAGANKMLSCAIEGDAIRLLRTEFAEKEWAGLAKGLLKAIRDKKRLLELIKQSVPLIGVPYL
jgi:hypothetical protein